MCSLSSTETERLQLFHFSTRVYSANEARISFRLQENKEQPRERTQCSILRCSPHCAVSLSLSPKFKTLVITTCGLSVEMLDGKRSKVKREEEEVQQVLQVWFWLQTNTTAQQVCYLHGIFGLAPSECGGWGCK